MRIRTSYVWTLIALVTLISGCSRSNNNKPAPEPPVPAPAPSDSDDDVASDLQPSIDYLRVDKIIRLWSDNPEIEWKTAITLGELSKLAYENDQVQQRVLIELGFDKDEIHPLHGGLNTGFVALANDVAVIAFRGTDERADWITNLLFYPIPERESSRKVHAGFQVAYSSVASQIREHLGNRNPRYVWITGHSLGGAMAACCAYDFIQNEVPFTGVVTFGQPRIGNEALANFLSDKTGDRYLRFMNEGDPVPLMPPCFGVKLPAYWHSGRRAWFHWNNLYTTQGPIRVAAPAPGVGEEIEESSDLEEPIVGDTYPSMTEEEFMELQQEFKERQEGNSRLFGSASKAETTASQPVPKSQGFAGEVKGFFSDRIGEHDMDEYLQKLNEFQRKQSP